MLALLGALSVAAAQPAMAEPNLRDACPTLAARLDSDTFVRADSSLVEAKGDMPAYCRVRGTIRPTIGFEMRLPISNWNGNYYVSGCGGYCGIMTTETPGWANGIVEPVKRGYAAIHTDSGHSGTSQGDAAWAPNNRLVLWPRGTVPLLRRLLQWRPDGADRGPALSYPVPWDHQRLPGY